MPVTDPKIRKILGDPLSDITRKERRNLLLASSIGLFVTWTGSIPTKVAPLGIELSEFNQQYFLILLSIVVGYFLVAFILYGIADFLVWQEKYYEHLDVGLKREILLASKEAQIALEAAIDKIHENHPDDPSADRSGRTSGVSVEVLSVAWT